MRYWDGQNPDAGIFSKYDDDDHSQGYVQFKESFRAPKKDDVLQPYVFDDNFRFSNVKADDVG